MVAGRDMELQDLLSIVTEMDRAAAARSDWLTGIESQLFEQKIKTLMVSRKPRVQCQPRVDLWLGELT